MAQRATRIWILAFLGHVPVMVLAGVAGVVFVKLGGLACHPLVVTVNFAVVTVMLATRIWWLKAIWRGVVWRRRHFFDLVDVGLALGLVWQDGFGGYERAWGIIVLPCMLVAAFVTGRVHRALRSRAAASQVA